MFNSSVYNGMLYNGSAGGGETEIINDVPETGEILISDGVMKAIGDEKRAGAVISDRVAINNISGEKIVSGVEND